MLLNGVCLRYVGWLRPEQSKARSMSEIQETEAKESSIETVIDITSLSQDQASALLESVEWNVPLAIQQFFDGVEEEHVVSTASRATRAKPRRGGKQFHGNQSQRRRRRSSM